MKHRLFSVLLILVLVFALTGCGNGSNANPTYELMDNSLKFYSYEQLNQAREENSSKYYEVNLQGLDFYYIPVYAEKHWEFTVGSLFDISIFANFNKTKHKETNRRNEYMLYIARPENPVPTDNSLSSIINPDSYSLGAEPPKL